MAAALVAIVTLQIGDDGSELAQSLEQNLLAALGGEEGIQAVLDGTGTDVTPEQYVNLLIQAAPVGIGILFVAVIAINAGIAQRLLALRGMALRPSPSVKDMELPFAHDAAFVGAIVLSLFPGTIGLVGTTLTALFLMSYFLLGLVVVHVMSSRWPSRGLVLFAFYLCLLVLSGLALFVAILGLADAAFGLRRRQTSPST